MLLYDDLKHSAELLGDHHSIICTARKCWPIGQFWSIQLLSVLGRHLNIDQFSFSLFFIGHLGSVFIGMDRNGPYYRIAPDYAGRA